MVKCTDCGKETSEDSVVYCDMCEAPLCEECGNIELCLTCAELWEAETDLENMEVEEG